MGKNNENTLSVEELLKKVGDQAAKLNEFEMEKQKADKKKQKRIFADGAFAALFGGAATTLIMAGASYTDASYGFYIAGGVCALFFLFFMWRIVSNTQPSACTGRPLIALVATVGAASIGIGGFSLLVKDVTDAVLTVNSKEVLHANLQDEAWKGVGSNNLAGIILVSVGGAIVLGLFLT